MDTAVALAKLATVWATTVTMALSVMIAYTGGIEARSAARSAARAAAVSLPPDWNCTEAGTAWSNATADAAAASGDRLRGSGRLRVLDFSLSVDTATCTVLASLEALPVTIGWWMGPIRAVGCSPTPAGAGLGLRTVCGQGP